MAKKSNLVNETVMYSINPGSGRVVTHHLPYMETSPQLQKYVRRGFTFERPQVEQEPTRKQVEVSEVPTCPICKRVCKTEVGLKVHMKSHKKKVK